MDWIWAIERAVHELIPLVRVLGLVVAGGKGESRTTTRPRTRVISVKPRFEGEIEFNSKHRGSANRGCARQRLGLRQPSAALVASGGSESARGLAQSKTWRLFERFLERPH